MADNNDYKVGYKRPPLHTRFKAGQSGNPAGRPKGTRNLKIVIGEALNTEVDVTVRGKKRQMTVLEAMVYRIFNSAVAGDAKAIPHALNLARMYDTDEGSAQDEHHEAERLELLRQLLASRSGGDDGSGK